MSRPVPAAVPPSAGSAGAVAPPVGAARRRPRFPRCARGPVRVVAGLVVVASFWAGSSPPAAGGQVPDTRAARVRAYSPLADAAADYYGIPRILVRAIIRVESDWRPDAVSSAGARGLMQVMPATGGDYLQDADLFDPAVNVAVGVRHLYGLLTRMDVVTALASWNAGEHAARVHGALTAYGETGRFVTAVVLEMERLAGRRPAAGP